MAGARQRYTNPRATSTSPRQLGTSPRQLGTNPRAARPESTTDAGRTADARVVRRTLGRAMLRMRVRGEACVGCGGRTTLDDRRCTCEPVGYAEAVAYLAACDVR